MVLSRGISRRAFVHVLGGAALAPTLGGCHNDPEPDVIIRQGRVFDGNGFRELDLALARGCITTLAPSGSLTVVPTATTVEAAGWYVTPGWVDGHVHLGPSDVGLPSPRLGAPMGATALVDAGTYGPQTFAAFVAETVEPSETPLFALLNLRADGLTLSNSLTRYERGEGDTDGAARLLDRYPHLIRGVKARVDGSTANGDDPLSMCRTAADWAHHTGLPLTVHLGEPEPHLLDLLSLLQEGDIVTHAFRPRSNCVVDEEGRLYPAVTEALSRGVGFDVGFGAVSFARDTWQLAHDQGLQDYTISSDSWVVSSSTGALTLANVLTTFLNLGLPLADIIHRVSVLPRQRLGLPTTIQEEQRTDLTIFSLSEQERDGPNGSTTGHRIIPEYAVIAGAVHRAGDEDRERFLA